MVNNKNITLHKPNEKQITVLYDVIKPTRKRVYSGLNTFSFNVPYKVEDSKTGKMMINPDLSLLRYRYLIKYDSQWYMITKINKEFADQTNKVSIECFSRGYVLKGNKVRSFKTGIPTNPVKNLSDTASLILQKTQYTLGTVSVSLDLQYRSIDIQSSNVLDSLNVLSERWDNCIWQEDSVNKRINFIDYTTDGAFFGLYLTENNYLKNIEFNMQEDSIITRLHLFGKNDVSINEVVSSGQNYIDDFSFFMNTDYMTQGLIDGLNDYNTALQLNNDTFADYLSQKIDCQSSLLTKQNELDDLQNEYDSIQKSIDIGNANGESVTTLKSQLANKQNEIDDKVDEINVLNSQIDAVDADINSLSIALSIDNYLTTSQQEEIKQFIIEDELIDNAITDKISSTNRIAVLQEFLEAGQKYLSLNNQPRYQAQLDVVAFNMLQDVDSKIAADNLKLGSIVMVKHKPLEIDLECKIIEIEEQFDDYQLSLTISNHHDIKSGFTTVKDLLKSASNTNNLVSLNLDNWNQGGEAGNKINEFLTNSIDTSVQSIKTSDNSFQLTERGLVMQDKTDPQYQMILNSNGLIMTENSGASYNVAISKGKIIGEQIGGKLIIGNSGKFNKIEMYNSSTNDLDVEIGNYTSIDGITQKRGIKIQGGSLEIIGSISPSLQYSNTTINEDGIAVTRSDNKFRTLINGIDGIKLQSGSGGSSPSWTDKFFADTNGNLTLTGILKTVDIQDLNGVSMLLNGKFKTAYIEDLSVGTNVTMGANATINWGQVIGAPTIPTLPAYITSTKITSTTIESPTITGGSLNTTLTNGGRISITGNNIESYSSNGLKTGVQLYASNSGIYAMSVYYNDARKGEIYYDTGSSKMWLGSEGVPLKIFAGWNYEQNMSISASTIYFEGNVSFQSGKTVDFTGVTVTGFSTTATAKFA